MAAHDDRIPVQAIVIKVTDCRWLKINRKPARMSSFDNAQYPHILHLRYRINGTDYHARRWLSWTETAPLAGETIQIQCSASRPKRFILE